VITPIGFEQPVLLKHRACPSNDPADDRVVPLGQVGKFLQKLAANVGPEIVVARADNIGCFQTRVRAYVTKHAGFETGRERIAEEAPAACVDLRPGALSSQKADRLVPRPLAPLGRRSENLRRPLSKSGEQIPKLHGIELDRRRRAEQDAPGVARHPVQEPEQVVRRRRRMPAPGLAGCARFVRLVEHHDAERFLCQRPALAGIVAIDDQPGRHDSNSPRAFRHQLRIAPLRQRPAFLVNPAFFLRRPDSRREPELVVQLLLPLPDERGGS
jgi:hypothetical protein